MECGGFLLREKGGKRVLVGYYRQTYYGRPSGHPSVCLQNENGIKPEFVFDGQLCLRKAEF